MTLYMSSNVQRTKDEGEILRGTPQTEVFCFSLSNLTPSRRVALLSMKSEITYILLTT